MTDVQLAPWQGDDELSHLDWAVDDDAAVEDLESTEFGGLGPAWRVIHSLVMGEERVVIDHLVIGPAGVFVIDTKHHPDGSVWVVGNTVKVNGDSEPYVHKARHQAQVVERLLSRASDRPVPVRGVVAIVCDPSRFSVKRQPDDVDVVRRSHIPHLLASLAERLSTDETRAIESVARRSSTWASTL